ncbi:hypothetical protein BASA62_006916 [Batrachochytrium salamandrivorans]|nr:hypothetical protein BASA62_006916 [Batrachochytrium salamandrivorans]
MSPVPSENVHEYRSMPSKHQKADDDVTPTSSYPVIQRSNSSESTTQSTSTVEPSQNRNPADSLSGQTSQGTSHEPTGPSMARSVATVNSQTSHRGDGHASSSTSASSPLIQATLPPAEPKRKRRVRHVQIQTRSAQLREVQTQTEAEQTQSGLDSETAKRIQALEAEISGLQDQHVSFSHKLSQTQQELSTTLVSKDRLMQSMDDNKKKFDGLSAQAYKKIKELLKDRQMLDIEVNVLKNQLESLDLQYQEWAIEDRNAAQRVKQ